MTLAGNITAGSQAGGTGQILLQASEGVTQSGGIIDTHQLLLGGDEAIESTGDFILTNANQINELAGILLNNPELTTATSVTLVKADYDSVCDDPLTNPLTESFTGLDIAGNATLTINGDLSQTTAPI